MMRRLIGALLLLATLGLVIGIWLAPATAQLPIGAVRIMGRHNQIADVTHTGQLQINAAISATVENVAHISSVTHVAVVGGLTVQSVSGPVPHISSTTHIGGYITGFGKQNTDVTDTSNTALRVNVIAGGLSSGGSVSQSGIFTVQAAHQGGQWNVAHISSVTHVAVASGSITVTGGPVSVTQSGAWTNLNVGHIASVVHVAIAGASGGSLPVNQSGGWVITADHQAGEWNIRHVGSVVHVTILGGDSTNPSTLTRVNHIGSTVHVAGIIRGFGTAGTNVVDTANAALQVNCVAGCSSNTSIAHITSVVHVQGAGGGLRVQQAGQFGGNRWIVDHISSAVHVVAAGGTVSVTQGNQPWVVSHISSVVHVAGQLEAVGEWRIAHQTSVVHIAGIVRGFGARGIDVVDLTNNALQINCVAGCSSNTSIAHISSLTHISGSVGAIPVTTWIRDAASTRIAHVDSTGSLQVAIALANISHVTSATHVVGSVVVPIVNHVTNTVHMAGIVRGFGKQGTDVLDATNQALQVNAVTGRIFASQSGTYTVQAAHQGGEWNIRHATSVTHVAGHVSIVGQGGKYVTVTGTALDVNCTGCSAAAVVNVAHVSSLVHISGSYQMIPVVMQIRDSATTRFAHVDASGALVTTATLGSIGHITSVLHVVVMPNSNANAVIAVHATQTGFWNINHQSSTVHMAGIIRGFGTQGTNVVDTANASLQVSCVFGCAAGTPIPHISSVTHVGGALMIRDRLCPTCNITVSHAGALTVNDGRGMTAGSQLFTQLVDGAANAAAVSSTNTGLYVTQAGQNGASIWRIDHVTSVTHVQGAMFLADKADPSRTAFITHANAVSVHIAGFGLNGGNPTFCHSVAAFVIHAGTNVAPVIHVSAGSKVAICGIVLTASAGVDVSLVEGNDANGDQNNQAVWSGGCGARGGPAAAVWTPLLGGASRGLALSSTSGFSSVSGVPWMQSQTRGNSVCLVKQQGSGHVTGTITYSSFK